VVISPALILAVSLELAGGVQTTWLSFTHIGGLCVRRYN
jgi:hypothetical protein